MHLLPPNAFSTTFLFEQTLSASVYVQSGPLPSQPGTQRPLLWSLLSMESSKKRSVIDLLFRLKRGVIQPFYFDKTKIIEAKNSLCLFQGSSHLAMKLIFLKRRAVLTKQTFFKSFHFCGNEIFFFILKMVVTRTWETHLFCSFFGCFPQSGV